MIEMFQTMLSGTRDRSSWEARAHVGGVDYSWQSWGEAALGLARVLVEGGVADQPVVVHTMAEDGGWVTYTCGSLRKMAG